MAEERASVQVLTSLTGTVCFKAMLEHKNFWISPTPDSTTISLELQLTWLSELEAALFLKGIFITVFQGTFIYVYIYIYIGK